MARHQRTLEQLTLEVGGDKLPDYSTFSLTGKLTVRDELYRGDEVTITIADADGVIVAAGTGYVKGIGFITHEETERSPEWVERNHKIKLRG